MVNSYDVAVLSEKVAYLEAALKSAGIELPVVSAADNGKTLQVVNGAWATGDTMPVIPAISDLVKVKTYTTEALSITAGGTGNFNPVTLVEADETMSGYTPIGIVGYKTSNANAYVGNLIYADGQYNAYFKNTSNEAISLVVTYDVLFIKSST